MTKTELNKTVIKIKKFLKQRDYDAIDTGIELARGLDKPEVFEILLDGVIIGVDKWKRKKLIRNSTFTGTGPAKPYLDYALWNLIGYAHHRSSIDNSIKTSNITELVLNWEKKDIKWDKFPAGCFQKLKSYSMKIKSNS